MDGKPLYYWTNMSDRVVPSDGGCVVLVNCTRVTVQGLNLTKNQDGVILAFTSDSAIVDNTFAQNSRDVYIHNSSGIDIIGNKITGYTGISSDSNRTRILDNTVQSNGRAIIMDGCYQTVVGNTVAAGTFGGGTDIISCTGSYNNITCNTFSGETYVGVVLGGSYNYFYENTVTRSEQMRVTGDGNVVIKNMIIDSGLSVSGSYNIVCANNITEGLGLSIVGDNNIFCSNTVSNNKQGVSISGTEAIAYDNVVYRNNFVNNTQQLDDNLAKNDSNFWDNGVEGNYWSDYNGTDQNNDGIGDVPYLVMSGTFDFDLNKMVEFVTGQDNYPSISEIKESNTGKWIHVFDAGTWEWTQYNVDVVSSSDISDFSFSAEEKLVRFNVNTKNQTTGFCRVTVPKEFMTVKDNNWLVTFVGGSFTDLTFNETQENTYIFFNYDNQVETIEIRGTTTIPEFPLWLILPLLLTMTLAVTAYKKKMPKKLTHQSY